MDHLTMLVLAGAAFGAWWHAIMRRRTPVIWKIAGLTAAMPIIVVYFLLEAARTRGVWMSGTAQAGWPVVLAMGLGFMTALGQMDGGARERGRGT